MNVFFTVCFLSLSAVAFPQKAIDVDKTDGLPLNAYFTVNGNPFVNYRYFRLVEGTPYFRDSWMSGIVVSEQDKAFKTSRVKLDLVDHEVHFLNEKGEELICTIPLKELNLTDTVSNLSFHFVNAAAVPALSGEKRGWYQQLANGKVSLFRALVKSVQETKPYNTGVAEQRIYTNEEYLVVHNGTVLKAKKPKDLPALLPNGKAALESYLKETKMKQGSTADQMTALVTYYNSLQ